VAREPEEGAEGGGQDTTYLTEQREPRETD
jgi:hypothetical protein